ncbi:MAG TPA: START-like domain-containing protein [Saprospiraceae bacterium]|nr:START-like domain-containing protein [Saprospiraceae bacterium]HMQ82168.1 START-like domain-containing protein [Saprospiraceae bacterium]
MERVTFTIEYIFRASPAILYQFLTTPACLVRWFCDEVDINGNAFTFFWDGYKEIADLIVDIPDELLRFRWKDTEYDNEYLEFKISQSPVTGETILLLTDFCDEDEVEDQQHLWNSQIQELKKEMGG